MAFDVSGAHTCWQDVVVSATPVCVRIIAVSSLAGRHLLLLLFLLKSHIFVACCSKVNVLVVEDDVHSSSKSTQGLLLLGYCTIRVCVNKYEQI